MRAGTRYASVFSGDLLLLSYSDEVSSGVV